MKYWEAEVKGIPTKFTSPTLKGLASKLGVKPSQIEGVYYRKRLNDTITIRKINEEEDKPKIFFQSDISGNFLVTFD